MALPSTVASNKYAVIHGTFARVWRAPMSTRPAKDDVFGSLNVYHLEGTPRNTRDRNCRTRSRPRIRRAP
eukprot:11160592-Lingulodinium_polyedra.AAC.1